MNLFRKFNGLIGAVGKTHSSEHISFGGGTHTGAASLRCFGFNFFPQLKFGVFNINIFRIRFDFSYYPVNLFHFQIDDVVHDALSQLYMFAEKIKIKPGFGGKWLVDIRIHIDGQQPAAIIWT